MINKGLERGGKFGSKKKRKERKKVKY